MASKRLETLCKSLTREVGRLSSRTGRDDYVARNKVADIARELINETTHPSDVAVQYTINMAEMACLRMFQKWKLLDKIPTSGSISYEELSASINADKDLIARMGQMLVATGKLRQPSPSHVAHTRLSTAFAHRSPPAVWFSMSFDETLVPWTQWPRYFAKYGRRQPSGQTAVPMTFAEGVDGELTCYEVIARGGPERMADFADGMQGIPELMPAAGIYDFTWVGEAVAEGEVESDMPLIVDVGGNLGQALLEIIAHTELSIPPDRCVLQDRADVIAAADALDNPVLKKIRKMPVDYHQGQPLKGALIYYVRRCLHGFTDEVSINLLRHLAAALPADPRARVLICEQITTTPPDPYTTMMDICMMNVGSKERSEDDFTNLVTAAGMKVIKFHRGEGVATHVIECARA
ncbi:S-adenosyl-L-methionine-dependent methyltransferase [Aspergillus campestris IBT 28561]|uniref:S-adenosyl-L-methionine-dependent methyltransferase n=1 Tax=Aspergillus campestris (strain IBT 28561) TaxID=1392248 RepID=A0A2I1DDD3_ASPC2|nr:S-adenosyl-L-methionine-dependent methyltransferase [Aspergillus campestris IBT 28561]PKY07889.1 S-adenosyl-L-methionine-dependent methyltransferase [Aspergillus campestris IBT 28561]